MDGPHLFPRERVQNRTPEQTVDSPVPQTMEAVLLELIVDSFRASDHGGQLAVCSTGTRAESHA